MVGFPNACTYTDWIARSTPVVVDTVWATTGDQFAWTCGYYAEYEWSGSSMVYFEISTNSALNLLASSVVLTVISALYL
jgi:hypothetical protein